MFCSDSIQIFGVLADSTTAGVCGKVSLRVMGGIISYLSPLGRQSAILFVVAGNRL